VRPLILHSSLREKSMHAYGIKLIPMILPGAFLSSRGRGGTISNFEGKEINIFSEQVVMSSDKILNQRIVEIIAREPVLVGGE